MIGQTLAHYKITGLLGKGGMGEVHVAEDSKLGRDVAIKVLPEELASDPERLARFRREARSIAALNHPRVVTIHSVEEIEGLHLLTMEVVEGKSLDQILPREGLELESLLDLGAQIADGLAAAHEKGITHRDLKPANVMVTGEGRVKLLDFGLVKLAEAEEGTGREEETDVLTKDGLVLGTVPYMSPEQIRGQPVDPRSDVFSLGVLLYEMATGSRPFQGDDPALVISAVLRDQPPPVTSLKAELPNHLGRIVRTCLEKDPAARYPTARQVHRDLGGLRREVSESAVRTTADVRGTGPTPGRRRAAWLAAASVALVVSGYALTRLLGIGGTSEESPATVEGAVRSIAVIGFENLSDPSDAKQLSRVLSGLITTDLAESGGLEVASTARVRTALRLAGVEEDRAFDPALAQVAAEGSDAATMLTGQVLDRDEQLSVTAELVDVASGLVIESLREEGSTGEPFDLAERLADGVRRRLLPVDERSGASFDLARSLTSSAEAYRLYTAGELAFRERRFEEARDRFAQTVERDETFALAYYRLADAAGWVSGPDETVAILERGLPHIERLPGYWQILYRARLLYDRGGRVNIDEAYALASELAENERLVPEIFDVLGEIHTHQSRYLDPRAAQDHFERALELDPTYRVVFEHLIADYIRTDDLEAGKRLVRRFGEELPGDPAVVEAEVLLLAAQRRFEEVVEVGRPFVSGRGAAQVTPTVVSALLRLGRWEEAREILDQFFPLDDSPFWISVVGQVRAATWLARGQFEAGIDVLERTSAATSTWGDQRYALYLVRLARVQAIVERGEQAVDTARRAVEADPFAAEARYLHGALLLAAGRRKEADRVLAAFHDKLPEWRTPNASFWFELLEAERSLVAGDYAVAEERLRKLETVPLGRRDPARTHLFRARLHEARGELDEAIASYEEVLTPAYLGDPYVGLSQWLVEIPALYHQARLMDQAGDSAGARRRFRKFLSYWGEADVDLPWVGESRRRLAKLAD